MKKSALIRSVLTLLLLLCVAAGVFGQNKSTIGVWQFKAPMPEGRSGVAAVGLGEYIYVIGGKNAGGQVLESVDRYHPATDTWEPASPLDRPRFNAAAAVWNGSIVVMGGRSDENETLNKVEQYNPATQVWTQLDNMDDAREGLSAVVLEGVLYAVGGSDDEGRIYDTVEYYNPDTNDWEVTGNWKLDLPRASFSTVAVDDSAFVIGGFNTFGPLGAIQRYHPVEGTANRTPLMPARGGLAAARLEDRVLTIGGITTTNETVDRVDVFIPSENRWRNEAPLNTPRSQFSAVALGDAVFVFGGEDQQGGILRTVEAFVPGTAPVAVDDAFTTEEDVSLSFNVLINDFDPAGGSLSISSFSQPAHGAVAESGIPGSFTYTPDLNFYGEDVFTYTVINDEGNSSPGQVIVTVNAVNDPPIFLSTPVSDGVVDELYTYEIAAGDVDGNSLEFMSDILPDWLELTDNGDGSASLHGTPELTDLGDHDVSLSVTDGLTSRSQSFVITVTMDVSVEEEQFGRSFSLYPPFPNPFSTSTRIEFDVADAVNHPVNISVYDLNGRLVATVFEGIPSVGRSSVVWDGTNNSGRPFASGMYYVRMTHKNNQTIQMLTLIR